MTVSVALKAMRVHQWTKNLLMFIPFALTPSMQTSNNLILCFLGFMCFSLQASGVYLINDILDMESDKKHPSKKNRPIASGQMSVKFALILSLVCTVTAIVSSYQISQKFMLVLLGYLLVTNLYSFRLKKLLMVDVFCLAFLYTYRIYAGAKATNISITWWLLSFSIFFFLGLAFAKRGTELYPEKNSPDKVSGRDYKGTDFYMVCAQGVAASFCSIIIYMLYIHEIAISMDRNLSALMTSSVVLLFWISRIWILVSRGEVDQDPVLFAVKDKMSYLLGGVTGLFVYLSSYL